VFFLIRSNNIRAVIKHNAAGAGGTLIDGEYVSGHGDILRRRNQGEKRISILAYALQGNCNNLSPNGGVSVPEIKVYTCFSGKEKVGLNKPTFCSMMSQVE